MYLKRMRRTDSMRFVDEQLFFVITYQEVAGSRSLHHCLEQVIPIEFNGARDYVKLADHTQLQVLKRKNSAFVLKEVHGARLLAPIPVVAAFSLSEGCF